MAISLGFGVIFVTPITLVLVPAVYRVLDDVAVRLGGRRAAAGRADRPN